MNQSLPGRYPVVKLATSDGLTLSLRDGAIESLQVASRELASCGPSGAIPHRLLRYRPAAEHLLRLRPRADISSIPGWQDFGFRYHEGRLPSTIPPGAMAPSGRSTPALSCRDNRTAQACSGTSRSRPGHMVRGGTDLKHPGRASSRGPVPHQPEARRGACTSFRAFRLESTAAFNSRRPTDRETSRPC